MNKYENILSKMSRIALGLFMIIFMGILFAIIPVIMIRGVGPRGVLFGTICIPLGGFFFLQGLSIMILNQKYKPGPVINGRSTIKPRQTLEYTALSMWFCFLGSVTFLVLSIYSFISTFKEDRIDRGILIFTGIVFIIMSIIYFLMAGKRKVNIDKNINIER